MKSWLLATAVALLLNAGTADARIVIERVYQTIESSWSVLAGDVPPPDDDANFGERSTSAGATSSASMLLIGLCCRDFLRSGLPRTSVSALQSGSITTSDALTTVDYTGHILLSAERTSREGSGAGAISVVRQFYDFRIEDTPETITFAFNVLNNGRSSDLNQTLNFFGWRPGNTFPDPSPDVGDTNNSDVQSAHYTATPFPGQYHLEAIAMSIAGVNDTTASVATTNFGYATSFSFANAVFAPGATQWHPRPPDGVVTPPPPPPGGGPIDPWFPTRPGNRFIQPVTGQYFDPELAAGYDFRTTESLLVTMIMGLPTGFDAPFEVWVDGVQVGTFAPPDTVDFVALLGQGVAAFQIRGIVPGTDPEDPVAFPIQLGFEGDGELVMTPVGISAVPEPATIGLLAVGLALLTIRRGTRQRRPA